MLWCAGLDDSLIEVPSTLAILKASPLFLTYQFKISSAILYKPGFTHHSAVFHPGIILVCSDGHQILLWEEAKWLLGKKSSGKCQSH